MIARTAATAGSAPQIAAAPGELPLLGEPLPIEFANTRYGEGRSAADCLGSVETLRSWLHHVRAAPPLPALRADQAAIRACRELRGSIRQLLDALAEDTAVPAGVLDTVNRYAAAATYHVRLELGSAGKLKRTTIHTGPDPLTELLCRLATDTVALAAGAESGAIRRCPGPGCTMLFLRDHHRRRWCHPSCGHRARQADYYRRTARLRTQPGPEGEGEGVQGS